MLELGQSVMHTYLAIMVTRHFSVSDGFIRTYSFAIDNFFLKATKSP